jgi:tetratricopeptide (TPR) repeat protein
MRPFFFIVCSFPLCLLSCNNREQAPDANLPKEVKTMDSLAGRISAARQYKEQGAYDKALAITDAMLQRFPGQLDAIGIRAEIFKEQGRTEEALALLEKAYALQPRDKETAYNLAYEYAEAKKSKGTVADGYIDPVRQNRNRSPCLVY